MVHACVDPNYNQAQQKIYCPPFDNLSVFTDSPSHTEYVDVGQLVQLDNLLLFSYSNINWIYPLHCCDELNATAKFEEQRSQLCNFSKTRISCYIRKAYFEGLYARSNPEIILTYNQYVTQQIYSFHLKVYSCFQGLTSRGFKTFTEPRLSNHH